MPVDPSNKEDVTRALAEALPAVLGGEFPGFAEPPEPLGRGFDTFIYGFRLAGKSQEPRWRVPLVLRLYRSEREHQKALREEAVQRFVAARGYPAPEPIAVGSPESALGLPFMIMERVDGKPMLERITSKPWTAPRLLASMAEVHVQLHRLPVEGFPYPETTPLVERQLGDYRERIASREVVGLDDGLAWLESHKQSVLPEVTSICHNDFHPLNVLVDDDEQLTVIDWSDATTGDRHCDVGRAVTLFWFAKIAAESAVERMALQLLRGFLRARYFEPYNKQLPVDLPRLRYWEALQTFSGWLQLSELALDRAEGADAQLDTVQRIPAALAEEARDHFWKLARNAERLQPRTPASVPRA